MRPVAVALSCLAGVASVPAVAGGAVESVPPAAVSLEALKQTELRDAGPVVIRLLELADRLVRQGVKYRRLKSTRRLSREALPTPPRRLSCSEFAWTLFSLAGLDMGEHPISSKRLAFRDGVYRLGLVKVTDGSIRPGDLLVYAHSADELARQKQAFGVSEVGHVVVVVSAERRIVVGSHGRESTQEGARRGAGYRRLVDGWSPWSRGRVLTATYRVRPDAPASDDE